MVKAMDAALDKVTAQRTPGASSSIADIAHRLNHHSRRFKMYTRVAGTLCIVMLAYY